MVHEPFKAVSRSINYSKWLSQNVAAPYILTYDESTSQRQLYQNPNDAVGDASIPRLPAINMSWEIVNNSYGNLTSFVILVQAAYSFRGRRLKPLTSLTKLLLKEEELLERSLKESTKRNQVGVLRSFTTL
jgi:hypothetical protein